MNCLVVVGISCSFFSFRFFHAAEIDSICAVLATVQSVKAHLIIAERSEMHLITFNLSVGCL